MSEQKPTLAECKQQAKALRTQLEQQGESIGHSQALERVARRYGFQDWNHCVADLSRAEGERYAVGSTVCGQYFSQPFEATVRNVDQVRPGWFDIELDLREAVDVVRFDSFSNFRRRVRGVVGPDGFSQEKTSDGVPHLMVRL